MPDNTISVAPFGRPNLGHPNYRANQEAARHKGQYVCETHCCCYCGKKALNGNIFAYLTNLGEFARMEDRPALNDDLGLYPVGSDCAKRLKKAGVTLYNAQNEKI